MTLLIWLPHYYATLIIATELYFIARQTNFRQMPAIRDLIAQHVYVLIRLRTFIAVEGMNDASIS